MVALALTLCLALAGMAAPAQSQGGPVGTPSANDARTPGDTPIQPACFAYSDTVTALVDMARFDTHWNCRGGGWDATAPVSWMRFDAADWHGRPPPRYLFTRISRFQAIHLAAVESDGTVRELTFHERDAIPVAAGPVFLLPLPAIDPQTRAIVVRIDGPHSAPMITEARLTRSPDATDWNGAQVLVLAIILGMLITPLFFDIAFYLVLRERFVLLHAGMTLGMVTYVAMAGGLLPVFGPASLVLMAVGAPLTWALGCAAGAFFLRDFLERGVLPAWIDHALKLSGWWTILGIGFASLQLEWSQSFDNSLYFYGFLPVIAIYLSAIVAALRNGSRAARYMAAAWVPLILAATDRLARGLGLYVAPSFFDQMLYAALALEVIVVALGVAARYTSLRRERDVARAEARMLENLSERDPLTGLLNRRALDERFGEMLARDFRTLALFDLDHFKAVNDTHGHDVGDKVLMVVAEVLSGEKDAVAVRMGGEEFMVMFAGPDAELRAEKLRQTISVRVARQVGELSTILTASVGLVHIPPSISEKTDFAQVYRRADLLLYEAKAGGRNLLASETLRDSAADPDNDNVTRLALG